MPMNYTTAVKNARMERTVELIGAGFLVIGTSAMNGGASGVLASIPFNDPAFVVENGAMTVAGSPLTTQATGTGVAARVEIRDEVGTVIASGLTIGLPDSGAEVLINAMEISTGQTVQVTVGTITHG